jgi:DNA-binding NarL/FixJ family response regulator
MHILIADDHAVVRRGLKEILADALPGTRFSEAGSGDEVLGRLAGSEVGLLVLDINMPGRSGLDVLRDVKHNYPRLPVIILSVQPEDQYAMRCLRAGAAAYVSKDSAPEELALAARKILSGGRYVSERLADKLVARLDEPADKPLHELLSDRLRRTADRNCRPASRQCKDRQQLPGAHHGQDANEKQCRSDPLRHDAPTDRLDRPVSVGITSQIVREKAYNRTSFRWRPLFLDFYIMTR